ncbi:hypothetical protein BGW36DRAFT_336440 [Talaromyces proteolyticus]|uniref:NAD(P)-binding protein n=1 Tax=Talaromyces proteolyticus TaxID=1131652 RepID=A0AAD4KYC6_9EURO|nr:uncharacterized protein BGW36DRAFT_336440 [Talaromyces proteolyticus]KAH8702063.1 hypothetical protein BGW36DRAFT_336440 [Talaromyces proteolyticus]
MTITRKSCLVTGCYAGGVGAALALAFSNKCYPVFATARSPSKIPQAMHVAPNITVLALDVVSSEPIAAVAKTVRSQPDGKLDVLINSAGLGLTKPAMDTSIAEAKKLFDANYFGVLDLTQAFIHMLVKARGCIVTNASVGSRTPVSFCSVYNGTKAALIQAVEVWCLEMAPLGVRVLTLITGGVQMKFLANVPLLTLPENSYYSGIKNIIEEQTD